jgi:ABC-type uncharacterized transport system involved in gliding motility auxiliary subunit
MKTVRQSTILKAAGGVAGLAVLFAILVAVNVILGNLRLRLDVTEERLYTLSAGTQTILRELDGTVTLKLFASTSSPQIPMYLKTYARQVEDLLGEYRMAAGRKLLVEVIDPTPDSDEEEWAQRYGISGQQADMFGPPLYFGLVAVAGDAEAVVPVLDPRADDLLEYTLTRLIYRVTHPRKPRVGVLSSLPVLGSAAPPFAMPGQPPPPQQPRWLAFRDLEDDYAFEAVDPDAASIDPTLDALVVIHPKDLPDATLYAIDQYLLGGGHMLAMVDPLSIADLESAGPNPYGMPSGSSSLDPLFKAWGLTYDAARIVADWGAASRIRAAENRIEESPVWLSLGRERINREDILTAKLDSLMVPFAGAFRDETGDSLTVTPLIVASEAAGLVDARAAQFGGEAIRREFKSGGSALPLAVRIVGTFPTAFPDGKPDAADAARPEQTNQADTVETALAEGESAVIVVADVDMLVDRFCVEELAFFGAKAFRPLNDNLAFMANAVEQMAGSTALIGIRSRGRTQRPYERVLALEERARRDWQAREDDLVRKLNETRRRLNELQDQKDASQRYILSKQQTDALTTFREEEFRIQRELKDVRKNLRRDIERLGMRIKLINIALMPACVVLGGIVFYAARKRRVK